MQALSFVSRGAVAQLGARLDGIEEVAGSNPAGSTTESVMFGVYILQSQSTGRYYVGQTKDLQKRVAYHNANYSRALKNRGPLEASLLRRVCISSRSCPTGDPNQTSEGPALSGAPN